MKMKILCYSKCSTCKKALAWLAAQQIEVENRDIQVQNPTEAELREWIQRSGFPIKRFFNTSGLVYRDLGLSKKLETMSDDDQIKLLASNGMLVKRPLLIAPNQVFVGFKEKEWCTLKGDKK